MTTPTSADGVWRDGRRYPLCSVAWVVKAAPAEVSVWVAVAVPVGGDGADPGWGHGGVGFVAAMVVAG
jgi:hypothetical protein